MTLLVATARRKGMQKHRGGGNMATYRRSACEFDIPRDRAGEIVYHGALLPRHHMTRRRAAEALRDLRRQREWSLLAITEPVETTR